MYIARILYPVRVLGPGERIGIWFDGCIHHCPGCSNPELWELQEKYHTTLAEVMHLVHMIAEQKQVDGFTLTGGDPFYQPDALEELLPELRKLNQDILVYTGYGYGELKHSYQNILDNIAVLIDGKYIEEQNHGSLLKGSDNQNIYILNNKYESLYDDYMKSTPSCIQNFSTGSGIISVGIHRPQYERELQSKARQKGLEEME